MKHFGIAKVLVALLLVASASASAILPALGIKAAEDSCQGRCDQTGVIPGAPCQCNKPCVDHGDCCADYNELCTDNVSDKELEDLTEELLQLDVINNATRYIRVDLQGSPTANENLLTVSDPAYALTTISKLLALHDNYNADVGITERFTPQQEAEIDDFIDAVLDTPLMKRAQEYLKNKNFPNGRENFYNLWFHLYNRGGQTNSSSGFEHVFIGELETNGVGGFHSWEHFAIEEAANRMDYLGYTRYRDFGARGSVIELKFDWRNKNKPVSSMFIGMSPEFELAVFTVCFYTRENTLCPISLNGNKFHVQTYTLTGPSGKTHVGTSYPDLSYTNPLRNRFRGS